MNISLALQQNGESQLVDIAGEIQETLTKLTTLYIQHAKLAAVLDLQSQLNLRLQENPSRAEQLEATPLPNGDQAR